MKFSFPLRAGIVVILGLSAKLAFEHRRSESLRRAPAHLKPLTASYEGKTLKRTTLGFRNLVADLIWIKLLQKAEHTPLAADEVSWEFAQLQAISELDPHFQQPYDFGVAYLSTFRRDKLGAKLLMERWVYRRPNYWKAQALLGHHLYFEMGHYSEASKWILRASTFEGAPPYLGSLGIRLLSETGALWQALDMAVSLYPNINSMEGRYRLKRRIRSLRYALEKSRWEEALATYRNQRGQEPRGFGDLFGYYLAERSLSYVDEELGPLLNEKFSFDYDRSKRAIVSRKTEMELGVDRVGIYRPET